MIMRQVVTFIVFLLVVYGYVRWLEQKSLYYPLRELEATPRDIGLEYEDVLFITADGVRLHGWLIPAAESAVTVVVCHGNGGNISHRLDKVRFFNRLGAHVFLFDYRGYGKSSGMPTEKGLYSDADAAVIWVRRRDPDTKLVLYGESLGGAVAVAAAVRHAVDGLIVEGTFTNVRDMAKIYYPWLPSFLLTAKFDSLAIVPRLTIPKLFLHARDDEIIPFPQGEALFQAAAEPKEFLALSGGHNDAFYFSQAQLQPGIDAFLTRLANR